MLPLTASVSLLLMGLQSLSDLCLLAKEDILVAETHIVSQLRQTGWRARRLLARLTGRSHPKTSISGGKCPVQEGLMLKPTS